MYYLGDVLDRKIKQYGAALEELRELILNAATNPTTWPGPYNLEPNNPSHLADLRFTVYSILHSIGAKPYFRVKVNRYVITVDYIGERGASGSLSTPVVGQDSAHQPQPNLEPIGDEGYREMFTAIKEEEEE